MSVKEVNDTCPTCKRKMRDWGFFFECETTFCEKCGIKLWKDDDSGILNRLEAMQTKMKEIQTEFNQIQIDIKKYWKEIQ